MYIKGLVDNVDWTVGEVSSEKKFKVIPQLLANHFQTNLLQK